MTVRVQIMLSHLGSLGWLDFLDEQCPTVRPFFEDLSEPTAPSTDELLMALSTQVIKSSELTLKVCQNHVPSLDPTEFEAIAAELKDLIGQRIPPAEIEGNPPSPWTIVLGSWLSAFGDRPVADLPAFVGDRSLSEFTMKSIELAAVLDLWRNDDPGT